MDEKPEALRLADALQQQAVWEGHYGASYLHEKVAPIHNFYAYAANCIEAMEEPCS